MDAVDEKVSMLSKLGTFWTRTQNEKGVDIARKLTHVSSLYRTYNLLQESTDMLLGAGYVPDYFRVIRFEDKDVLYMGMRDALQQREVAKFDDVTWGASRRPHATVPGTTIAEDGENPIGDIIDGTAGSMLFPMEEITGNVPADFRMRYALMVPGNMHIHSIEQGDGAILYEGLNFRSGFGWVQFPTNPIQLFDGMRFIAKAVTLRKRNLLSYTLLADDVYGDVDRIVEYYRRTQSFSAFYYAAAQAIGMPVTREKCVVMSVLRHNVGASYFTTIGRLDALYPHHILQAGAELPANYVIGREELFNAIWATQTDAMACAGYLPYVELDEVLPFKGLMAPNQMGILESQGKWRPAFTGDAGALTAYYAYLQKMQTTSGSGVQRGNVLQATLNTLSPRWMIIRVNRNHMPQSMQLRLQAFLTREKPLACALLYCPIDTTLES